MDYKKLRSKITMDGLRRVNFHLKEGDTADIELLLYMENEEYRPTVRSALILGVGKTKKERTFPVSISQNRVYAKIPQSFLQESGETRCELRILTNKGLLKSQTFYINIEKSLN